MTIYLLSNTFLFFFVSKENMSILICTKY
uniref:Uncharacterized protein n=1 Tax=Anguilla anguilla TaxID=7936 RepID=A0A0E9W9L4_ANGAN